jgi:homogentisate 1,2-dioxygenase
VFYDFCPLDVVGWKGTHTVFKLNVKDFRPLMSEGVHLPPSAHGTFEADGFVVCTIAPRPLEGDPQALRVPWYHRNIDYDEVFFVHRGEFTLSRRSGTTPGGVLSLNPQGLHHGPQPGVWENSVKNWQKDVRLEFVAINLDTQEPLTMTEQAQQTEIAGYADLWARK